MAQPRARFGSRDDGPGGDGRDGRAASSSSAQPRARFSSRDDGPAESGEGRGASRSSAGSIPPPFYPPKLGLYRAGSSPPPPAASGGGDNLHSPTSDRIRRMSSELSTLDHEAASYIAQERESMAIRPKSSWEKAKEWVADVQIIRIPSVPIFKWLPKYSLRQQFSGDLNAGLACAVLLIPQGMAYGIQLGIPVIHGLYSAIFFGLVYAVMGTSRETCPANTALVTMMAASALDKGLPEGYSKDMRLVAAIHFTFLVGVFQVGLGLFRLGAIVHYVSYPVLVACNSAGILITVISQLKYFLGIKVPPFTYTHQILEYLIMHLPRTNLWELLVGSTGFFLMYGMAVWKKRPATGTRWDKACRNVANLTPVLVMVYATVLSWVLCTYHDVPMKIIGDLPSGFQTYAAWDMSVDELSTFATPGLTVAVVSFLLSYSAQKAYANKGRYEIMVDQELSALGLSNVIGSFFGSFVAVTGFARSAVNYEAGGRTQVAALVASGLIIVAVQWLGPIFFFIPMSGLAALLCGALVSSFNVQPYIEAYHTTRRDFFVLMSSAIIMLAVGIDTGIYCGIAISICGLLLQYSYPDLKQLGRLPGGPGGWRTVDRYPQAMQLRNIRVLRLDEALTFVNGDYVREELVREARKMEREAAVTQNLGVSSKGFLTTTKTAKVMADVDVVKKCTHGGGSITPVSRASSIASTAAGSVVDCSPATCGCLPGTTMTREETEIESERARASVQQRPKSGQQPQEAGAKGKKRCHHFIVLDASGINWTDLSGIHALADASSDLRDLGVRLLIARAKNRLRDTLRSSERLFHDLGGEKMYLSLEEMVYLLERHDIRLHGTPFASTTDLVKLGQEMEASELKGGSSSSNINMRGVLSVMPMLSDPPLIGGGGAGGDGGMTGHLVRDAALRVLEGSSSKQHLQQELELSYTSLHEQTQEDAEEEDRDNKEGIVDVGVDGAEGQEGDAAQGPPSPPVPLPGMANQGENASVI